MTEEDLEEGGPRVIEALIEEVTLALTYQRRHSGGILEALDNSFNRGLEVALETLYQAARQRGITVVVPSREIDPKTAMPLGWRSRHDWR